MEEVDEFGFPIFDDIIIENAPVYKCPPTPHFANIVAGQYKGKDGTFCGREYFYKDRINNDLGGLEIGDIALAYIKRINRCVPFKITRTNISKEELAEAGISRADLTCLRYLSSEDYTK